jgi:hypothetical protein
MLPEVAGEVDVVLLVLDALLPTGSVSRPVGRGTHCYEADGKWTVFMLNKIGGLCL